MEYMTWVYNKYGWRGQVPTYTSEPTYRDKNGKECLGEFIILHISKGKWQLFRYYPDALIEGTDEVGQYLTVPYQEGSESRKTMFPTLRETKERAEMLFATDPPVHWLQTEEGQVMALNILSTLKSSLHPTYEAIAKIALTIVKAFVPRSEEETKRKYACARCGFVSTKDQLFEDGEESICAECGNRIFTEAIEGDICVGDMIFHLPTQKDCTVCEVRSSLNSVVVYDDPLGPDFIVNFSDCILVKKGNGIARERMRC